MTDIPFSNREIKELFKAADDRADAFHEKLTEKMDTFEVDVRQSLSRIELQTTQHNGRMTKVEKWQSYISGGMTVLTIIVVPILAWALWVLVNIQGQVHNAVDDALSAYNIEK